MGAEGVKYAWQMDRDRGEFPENLSVRQCLIELGRWTTDASFSSVPTTVLRQMLAHIRNGKRLGKSPGVSPGVRRTVS
jgi:hypothetical protein